MKRCLEIASAGSGKVAPNPMVGAVIVHNGKVISEGFHRIFGAAHAEVEAIQSVVDKEILKESTIYVSLEPCSHQGKTPPCADLIIKSKIPEVVIACLDPNPLVSGKGKSKLEEAGIKVLADILKEAAIELNKRFFTSHLKKRPYIILKWAESADGFISPYETVTGRQKGYMISSEPSRVLVHKWRSEEASILVGAGTVITDDPSLNVRLWDGKDPVPVIMDPEGIIPSSSKVLLNDKVIIYGPERNDINAEFIKISEQIDPIISVLETLYNKDIESLFVEGGAYTHNAFLNANLWDEIRIIKSKKNLNKGLKAPQFKRKEEHHFSSGSDEIYIYRNKNI